MIYNKEILRLVSRARKKLDARIEFGSNGTNRIVCPPRAIDSAKECLDEALALAKQQAEHAKRAAETCPKLGAE